MAENRKINSASKKDRVTQDSKSNGEDSVSLPRRNAVNYGSTRVGMSETSYVSDEDFTTSAAAAYATDSALLGIMTGGSVSGALIGDALNKDDDTSCDYSGETSATSDNDSGNSYGSDSSNDYDSGIDYGSSDSSSSGDW